MKMRSCDKSRIYFQFLSVLLKNKANCHVFLARIIEYTFDEGFLIEMHDFGRKMCSFAVICCSWIFSGGKRHQMEIGRRPKVFPESGERFQRSTVAAICDGRTARHPLLPSSSTPCFPRVPASGKSNLFHSQS